jgi:hypothetical protein
VTSTLPSHEAGFDKVLIIAQKLTLILCVFLCSLAEKGIHEVSQRRFVLVAADHPLVSAISENAE